MRVGVRSIYCAICGVRIDPGSEVELPEGGHACRRCRPNAPITPGRTPSPARSSGRFTTPTRTVKRNASRRVPAHVLKELEESEATGPPSHAKGASTSKAPYVVLGVGAVALLLVLLIAVSGMGSGRGGGTGGGAPGGETPQTGRDPGAETSRRQDDARRAIDAYRAARAQGAAAARLLELAQAAVEAAVGTDLSQTAQGDLNEARRAFDEAARAAFRSLQERADALAAEERFDEAIALLDQFPREFASTGWAGSVADLRTAYEHRREQAIAEEQARQMQQGVVIGNIERRIYHEMSCVNATRLGPDNAIQFRNRDAAERQGYQPARCCHPR